ncbi:MAG: hypothetical protein EBR34_08120 [Sphingomonadaceae bacterium]|nr:hypothetical protein [Sphingomonadaceae bacterium]
MRDWHFIPDNSGHWQYSGDDRPRATRRRGFTFQRAPIRFTLHAIVFMLIATIVIAKVQFNIQF